MNEMMYIILGCLCALLVVLLVVLLMNRRSKGSPTSELQLQQQQRLLEDVSARVNKELMQFQGLLHQGMQQDIHTLREDTTQRLFSMEKSMNESMHYQLETTGKAFNNMMSEMGKINLAQQHLEDLSYHIHDLEKVLNDKKTRGIFGEMELYSLLESVMGDNYQRYGKQVKLSNGTIVDAVLYASDPMPMICIDSKFPLENYQRLMNTSLSKEDTKRAQILFGQDVKKHIKAISDKYIIAHETAEFAYLFLPAESIFAYIHGNLSDIVQYSFEQHVYLVSPTTLMAYITAIKAIYLGQQRNDNMREIQTELKKLAIEFERFEKRYQIVANDFEKNYNDMRQVSITAQKLIRRFQEIQNVDLEKEGD